MKVKVTEYNNRNGPIRWQISTPIKVILDHFFRQLSLFSGYSHFQFRDLENVGQSRDVKYLQWRIRWQIPDFLSDGNSNVCICRSILVNIVSLNSLTL